jgi:hypothetical protein
MYRNCMKTSERMNRTKRGKAKKTLAINSRISSIKQKIDRKLAVYFL